MTQNAILVRLSTQINKMQNNAILSGYKVVPYMYENDNEFSKTIKCPY